MNRCAVFLDKDGTLVEDVPYNVNPSRLILTAGVLTGLQLLYEAGYALIVISNQSGVARGYFTESALVPVWRRLQEMLSERGVVLSDFYYCPHHPSGSISAYAIHCDCRKPQPGLLYQAAAKHSINLRQSWFIGDILNDVEAGRSAGCRTILLDNGNETEWQLSNQRLPHHIVADLSEAARVILAVDEMKQNQIDHARSIEPTHSIHQVIL